MASFEQEGSVMSGQHQEQQATHAPTDLPVCGCEDLGYCVTCSDEAMPARVLGTADENGLALVDIAGTTLEIDVTLVDAIVPGDWLLTHGGVAIGRLEGLNG